VVTDEDAAAKVKEVAGAGAAATDRAAVGVGPVFLVGAAEMEGNRSNPDRVAHFKVKAKVSQCDEPTGKATAVPVRNNSSSEGPSSSSEVPSRISPINN
jgi:hypothetical protein